MTAAGLAARVVFLVAWLIALTVLIFAARGSAPGGPVAERVGYAVGATRLVFPGRGWAEHGGGDRARAEGGAI